MTAVQHRIRQSQWVLIWRQFRRRRLAVAAAVVIALLFGVSIFAPLIAHDRPLYYVGSNRFDYQEAARTLRALLGQISSESQAGRRSELLKSARLQWELMAVELPVEDAAKLREFGARATAAASTPDAAELRKLQIELRKDFSRGDLKLRETARWPVLASLGGMDLFFMTGYVVCLAAPLGFWGVSRLAPIGRQHALRRSLTAAVFAAPVLAAAGWWWFVPQRLDRTNYKLAVLAADPAAATAPVVFRQVLWPPIPFAIDEDDLSRKAAPPYWALKEPAKSPSSPWNSPHWLGTDDLGRDILCRMIWGGRVSLAVGVVAVSIYTFIGIIVGAVAGYFRGFWDLVISRIIEVVICFPAFFLILTIVAFFGPGLMNIMIIIGLTGWTGIARLVRGEFLRLVDQEFVLAGKALGYSAPHIIFRHVLPNALAPVLVSATFGVAGAILTESSLSFLGLGISVPTPSWGSILSSGRDAIFRAPWLIQFPGLAIFITITCYNLVGEALRDASDPRLRGSRA